MSQDLKWRWRFRTYVGFLSISFPSSHYSNTAPRLHAQREQWTVSTFSLLSTTKVVPSRDLSTVQSEYGVIVDNDFAGIMQFFVCRCSSSHSCFNFYVEKSRGRRRV